tara:strand:+ start:1344 stop:1955 length:612 start_codon:yes stop_codon:yes gene_type:complete
VSTIDKERLEMIKHLENMLLDLREQYHEAVANEEYYHDIANTCDPDSEEEDYDIFMDQCLEWGNEAFFIAQDIDEFEKELEELVSECCLEDFKKRMEVNVDEDETFFHPIQDLEGKYHITMATTDNDLNGAIIKCLEEVDSIKDGGLTYVMDLLGATKDMSNLLTYRLSLAERIRDDFVEQVGSDKWLVDITGCKSSILGRDS